jgi:hypothetical protein
MGLRSTEIRESPAEIDSLRDEIEAFAEFPHGLHESRLREIHP